MTDDKNKQSTNFKDSVRSARRWAIGMGKATARVASFPIVSIAAGSAIWAAEHYSDRSEFSQRIGGQRDAYRHLLWASETRRQADAISMADPDVLDQHTRDVLLVHEDSGNGKGQPPDEENMDRYNNDVGIALGRRAVEEDWDAERLRQEVYNTVKNSDGTGKNNTPFWYDKSDPKRKPPQGLTKKPLSVREELEKNYRVEKQKAEVANQNAANSNTPRAPSVKASSGGTVHVKAYDREGGAEHVRSHTRKPPVD